MARSLTPRHLAPSLIAPALAALAGCMPPPEPPAPNVRVYSVPLGGDVAGMQYDISCQDGTMISEYVPLEDEGMPSWLLPAGAGADHSFSDLFTMLPAGVCDVTVSPMQSPGVPSDVCAPSTQTVTVMPEVTTEIVMILQCEGDPAGGLDVVAGLNFPPDLTALGLLPSKFILLCEELTIEPTVVDPDGDDVTTTLSVITQPAGAQVTLTQTATGWTFSTDTPGFYELELVATDVFGASTRLTFPAHVTDDPAACGPAPVCCQYDEIFSHMVPADQCDADSLLGDEQCDIVCCSDGFNPDYTATRYECDMTGAVLSEGACVTTVCCEMADGSFGEVDDVDCPGGAVAEELCDVSPTCCLLPDLSLASLSVSECVQQGGSLGDEGCESCAPQPAGPGFSSVCVASPTGSPDPARDWSITPNTVWSTPALGGGNVWPAHTPILAHLADTNADGSLDDLDDTSALVIAPDPASSTGASLNAIDLVSGATLWTRQGALVRTHPAAVDLDGDLVTEVLTLERKSDGSVVLAALDHNGGFIWSSPALAVSSSLLRAPSVQPHDLDGDGDVEIVVGNLVLDGSGGQLLHTLGSSAPRDRAAIGDLDLDGVMEVVLPDGIFDPVSGALEVPLTTAISNQLTYDTIVQLDADPEGEIARYGSGQLTYLDTDGSQLGATGATITSVDFGSPCVADFDGDGRSELIAITRPGIGGTGLPFHVQMFELDPATVAPSWTASIVGDFFHTCTGADLNGDGASEVLLGTRDLRILDGSNGSTLYLDARAPQGVYGGTNAQITVADVDADSVSELVAVWGEGAGGASSEVVVYEHDHAYWPDLGSTWTAFDYHTGRMSDQGAISTVSPLYWHGPGHHQAKVAEASGVDLVVQFDGVCVDSCDPSEVFTASLQVHNLGDQATPGDVDVTVYSNTGGALTLLQVVTIPGPIAPESSASGALLTLSIGAIGADGLVAIADDPAAISECNEANNAATWTANPCD